MNHTQVERQGMTAMAAPQTQAQTAFSPILEAGPANAGSPNDRDSEDTLPGQSIHALSPLDPDSPMTWPLWKKLYTSAVAFGFAFVILYATTTYTVSIPAIKTTLGVSQNVVNLGYTFPFLGVFFAPLYTPHLSERFGRRPVYLAAFPLFTLCVVVIGLATNISSLLAFRFFAGLFGGPCLVLIEGTFADIWSAEKTVTYYAFLTIAQYWGAALGAVIGGFVLPAKGLPWLAWVALLFAASALAFGCAMPETYPREILRKRNHYTKRNVQLPEASSGSKLKAMARITLFSPLRMLVSEPLVILISLHVGLNFAVLFQWLISVPAALSGTYSFSVSRSGLAFLGALCGSLLALLSCALIEGVTHGTRRNEGVEKRLLSAIVGSLLITAALWWVGYTVSPQTSYLAPIFGTAVYVWGSAMIQISYVSYLFDAYPPTGTLSALTAAACFRLACAGIVPIFISNMIGNLGPKWAFGTFGIIAAVMVLIPCVLFFFGLSMRTRSRYAKRGELSTVEKEVACRESVH